MKNYLLFIAFISLSYFANAQCNVTINGSPVSCNSGNDGSAIAFPIGGTGPFTYAWTPSGGTGQTATNLAAGTYTCTITDALSCVTFSSVNITEPTALVSGVSSSINVSCNGGYSGSAVVDAFGGTPAYTYAWNTVPVQSSVTATGLSAGVYTVSVSDGNGCLTTTTVVITEPPVLVASALTVNGILCYGDCNASVTVLANGGNPPYAYLWNPTGQTALTATGLCEGEVDVTVTDNNGCTFTSGDSISAPAALVANLNGVVNATCGNNDGSAAIYVNGGTGPYTYLWTPVGGNGTTASNLASGIYTATVTDAHGCIDTAVAVINNGVVVTLSSYSNVSCTSCCDGSISASASGGTPPYTYLWTPSGGNSATASNLCTGVYNCTVTDANSCSGIFAYQITDLYSLSGSVYFDANQNGIWDAGEPPLSNQRVQINPVNIIAYTDVSGNYYANVHAGSYTISYLPPATFTQTSLPATYSVLVSPSQTGLDFGSYSSTAVYDQYFYVWNHPLRCAPAYGYSYIDVSNTGMASESGSITMIHSSNIPFYSSSPLPDVVSGDTLVWHYVNLQPYNNSNISGIEFIDPPAGNTVWYTVVDSVTDLAGNPVAQYTDSFSFVVTCSCDPNDKEVNPPGFLAQHYTAMNSELTYTLNFQNTGNDTAFNVAILDTLNANLNLSTFKVVGNSHPVSTEILPGRIARFTFSNIQLPDSNVDFNGSNAYVAYSIKPNNALPEMTVINNTAHVFFDSNPPVATNTAYNTFTNSPLSVNQVSVDDGYVIIYPNPFHSSATLILNEQFLDGEIIIYDAVGKEVQKSKVINRKSEISNLSSGIYFLEVEGAKSRMVKKLIVY